MANPNLPMGGFPPPELEESQRRLRNIFPYAKWLNPEYMFSSDMTVGAIADPDPIRTRLLETVMEEARPSVKRIVGKMDEMAGYDLTLKVDGLPDVGSTKYRVSFRPEGIVSSYYIENLELEGDAAYEDHDGDGEDLTVEAARATPFPLELLQVTSRLARQLDSEIDLDYYGTEIEIVVNEYKPKDMLDRGLDEDTVLQTIKAIQ